MAKTVAMFGSARPISSDRIYKQSKKAAALLAKAGWTVATGGGPGLMQACNEGALENCQEEVCSLGYSIYLPFEAETNPAVQHDTHHKTFFTRLEQFSQCDAFIALPGGYGTMLEILTVVQLLQVEHIKPVPLFLVGKEWRSLMTLTENILKDGGFVGTEESNFWEFRNTPMDAAEALLAHDYMNLCCPL
jgi:uncharacterized protein (TIGR00730 family)